MNALRRSFQRTKDNEELRTQRRIQYTEAKTNYATTIRKKKKLAASSMLHEAKIAYYAFDVIVYCMYTHQTRIAYTKRYAAILFVTSIGPAVAKAT